jgi:hypothetical protein
LGVRNNATASRPPGFTARHTLAKAAVGSAKNMTPKRENTRSTLSGMKGYTETSATMASAWLNPASAIRRRTRATECSAMSAPRTWTARADPRRQFECGRAAAAADVEDMLARPRRRELQELFREVGQRSVHALVLVGPGARRRAVPEFTLRRIGGVGFLLGHAVPLRRGLISAARRRRRPARRSSPPGRRAPGRAAIAGSAQTPTRHPPGDLRPRRQPPDIDWVTHQGASDPQ